MNELPKIVFSKTLDRADWHNTRLVRQDAVQEASRMKSQPGKDLFIMGSANLAGTFARGRADTNEYRVMVNPVLLGRGQPLFQGVDQPLNLHLQNTRTFQNGNVLLYYSPQRSWTRTKGKPIAEPYPQPTAPRSRLRPVGSGPHTHPGRPATTTRLAQAGLATHWRPISPSSPMTGAAGAIAATPRPTGPSGRSRNLEAVIAAGG